MGASGASTWLLRVVRARAFARVERVPQDLRQGRLEGLPGRKRRFGRAHEVIGADHRVLFEQTEKEAPGFAFDVRSMTIDYLKPAKMDDILEVITHPGEVKGASIVLKQKVTRGDDVLVTADVRVAFVSGGRARPIPKPLRIAMKADQDVAGAD